ncbi:MAG: AsmA-like C-terminal region-containing protein, partial [Steroidobacteraceae bacterium]
DALRISDSSFTGAGTGSWLQTVDGSLSTLALTLESTDVRATLRQLNYGEFIAAKRGKLVANLQWPDGLDENLLGRSSGTLTVQVDEGQLLNVEPGAGRVLGLLSIAALPRRLGLDFRDLTDKGLSFDSVHGDFTVTNGDARTQNLLLRGATAEIGIVGRLGLGARDYDQTAVVTGNVTGALPVAAVVAGGPVIGAAMLLFSQVFKEPLKGVARAYYHIGGGWDDPQVERIDADAAKASLSDADASLPQ